MNSSSLVVGYLEYVLQIVIGRGTRGQVQLNNKYLKSLLVLWLLQGDKYICSCKWRGGRVWGTLNNNWTCVCCVFSLSVVSNSFWPHGLQPSRLFCPWNFPGNNTDMGCHFSLPGALPHAGIEHASLVSLALAGRFFTISTTWEVHTTLMIIYIFKLNSCFCFSLSLFLLIVFYKKNFETIEHLPLTITHSLIRFGILKLEEKNTVLLIKYICCSLINWAVCHRIKNILLHYR